MKNSESLGRNTHASLYYWTKSHLKTSSFTLLFLNPRILLIHQFADCSWPKTHFHQSPAFRTDFLYFSSMKGMISLDIHLSVGKPWNSLFDLQIPPLCVTLLSIRYSYTLICPKGGGGGLLAESCLTLCNSRPLRPWDFPGKNTGVGCHFLLQGIFQTQGSNLRLLCHRWILYHWATWEALVQKEAIQPCWKQNYSVMNARRTLQNGIER